MNPADLRVLRTETPAGELLPYSHHVTPSLIATRTGDLVAVWHLAGRSHQSAGLEDVFGWTRDLNHLLRGLAGERVALWSHVVRRPAGDPPEGDFANPFADRLDAAWRATHRGRGLMVNDLYLSVVLRAQADAVLGLLARGERETLSARADRQARDRATMEDMQRALGAGLARYGARRLGLVDRRGHAYSEALEALGWILNGENRPVPLGRARAGETLLSDRVIFSRWGEIGERRRLRGTRIFGMLELVDYPHPTEPGQLNALLDAPYAFVLTQSFSAHSLPASLGYLERHRKTLLDTRDAGVSEVAALEAARDALAARAFVMGAHHATLLVEGANAAEVRERLAHARATALDAAMDFRAADLSLEAAFWAQMPGNFRFIPRPAPITSENFLCFSPFHNFMAGRRDGNPWGPATTLLRTTSDTPLFFSFHAGGADGAADDEGHRAPGNTLVIGKTGTGKTVLLGFLLAQALRHRPTVVAFDRDRGLEPVIRALGGAYWPLALGTPTGFNPLSLDDTAANRLFLSRFLADRAASSGEAVTHDDRVQLDRALESVLTLIPPAERRLSVLLQFLPDPRTPGRPSLHARLARWCWGGEFGWLFDAPPGIGAAQDADLADAAVTGFDVTEFLEHPELRGPVYEYLVHRTSPRLDGRRFVFLFDEFHKPLADPGFRAGIQDHLLTIRKKNGLVIGATQEPGAILHNPIGRTLVQQAATLIFLPNPAADRADYVEGFKLSEAEFECVRGLGETSRRFLIRQGGQSAIASLDLTGMNEALAVLAGTPERSRRAERLAATHPDPADWLDAYLRAETVETAA